MNAFRKLLELPAAEKECLGVVYTPPEIAQQPAVWEKTVALLKSRRAELLAFLESAGMAGSRKSTVILTGAGTSEFIGSAVAGPMKELLGREVVSVPTTHLVTHAPNSFVPGHNYTVISFARSGNSPESLATYKLVDRHVPSVKQIVITCNKDGALAQAAQKASNALCLVLPEETNDRSLAMTSSFSSMVLTGLCLSLLPGESDATGAMLKLAQDGANRIVDAYGDLLHQFAALKFDRAEFLGSGSLYGTMQECHLKMQEMTNGNVVCRYDTFLGVRHGPQVFVTSQCAVIAALASAPSVRRYELDLLRELARKKQGCGVLVICDKVTPEIQSVATHVVELFPGSPPLDDRYRILTDVVAGQILGVFKSMALGMKPDTPSPSGTINRVVQGVTIYDV
jgi:tagatose-6-phosphate ketose/aldose isomerase